MRFLLYLLLGLGQARPLALPPDTSLVRASLLTEKPFYFLGEPVPVRYCLDNISQATFEAGFSGAPQRFAPVARDEFGLIVPHPSMTLIQPDEMVVPYSILPGQRHCEHFDLMN